MIIDGLYIFRNNLIKELGFDVNLKNFKDSSDDILMLKKVNIDGYNYEIPNFLILEKIPKNLSNFFIKKSLIFTRGIMLNKFFIKNNIPIPRSRIILENYFI